MTGHRLRPNKIRAERPDLIGHLADLLGPQGRVRCINVGHLKPPLAETHLIQKILGICHPLFRSHISFQEMAAADLSPPHQHAVRAGLKRPQNVQHIDSAGTG